MNQTKQSLLLTRMCNNVLYNYENTPKPPQCDAELPQLAHIWIARCKD